METTRLFQKSAPASVAAPNQTGRSYRILIADDDPVMQEFYAAVLTPFGYQVDSANDGAAAWEALCANSYNLLITDNRMPRVCHTPSIRRLDAE